MTTYYTLAVKTPADDEYVIEFGDYDRDTVKQEQDDLKDSGEYVSGTKYIIFSSGDDQASIIIGLNSINEGGF